MTLPQWMIEELAEMSRTWSDMTRKEDEKAMYALPEGYYIDVEKTPTGMVDLTLRYDNREGYLHALGERIVTRLEAIPVAFEELCEIARVHDEETNNSNKLLAATLEFATKHSLI